MVSERPERSAKVFAHLRLEGAISHIVFAQFPPIRVIPRLKIFTVIAGRAKRQTDAEGAIAGHAAERFMAGRADIQRACSVRSINVLRPAFRAKRRDALISL